MADLTVFSIILIILACVFPFFALAASIIYLCYYGSPDDSKLAWFPKGIVVLAFALAILSVFLLPLDIANARLGAGMTFGLGITWQVFYGVVCIFVILVIPFGIFYYEAEDPDKEGLAGIFYQCRWATLWEVIVLVIAIVAIGVSYYFLGIAEVPYTNITNDSYTASLDSAVIQCANCITDKDQILEVFVSIVVYVIACTSMVGYLVFVICGGWGLSALPVSCIKAFITKPKRVKGPEFATAKEKYKNRIEQLIEIGQKLQEAQDNGRVKPKDALLYNDFRDATYKIENDWKILHKSYFDLGGSVIFPFIQLLLGIVFACLSLLWFVQIICYMIVPPPPISIGPLYGFLNIAFAEMDGWTNNFPVFGCIFYLIMTFYLLCCCLAGTTLFSQVVPIVSVHPMKYKDTMMNSILFNTGVFLLCSISVNQFAEQAFAGYARTTALDTLFNSAIRNLKGIKWYFFSIPYAYLFFAGIGLVMTFICCRPRSEQEKNLDQVMARLKTME
ncbi:lipocalin-interacting membrane receptor [Acrasis kona]|uniref:Lipocalin-interacting membrane receptor n=1 Tax=Acrasis kona TaxID=1008807 RepID=A0AAW2YIQ5_9EUKA